MLNKARLGVRVTTCSEAAGGGEGVGGRGVGRPEWEAFVPNDLRAKFLKCNGSRCMHRSYRSTVGPMVTFYHIVMFKSVF